LPLASMPGPQVLHLRPGNTKKPVNPKPAPEPQAKNRHDRLMIEQAAKRLSPVEETMVRSVLAGGGAEADALARTGEPLRIDQSIQLGHLRRLQDVVEHQIALKIEKVLLKLPVRSVHGHSLLVFAGTGASLLSVALSPTARPDIWSARQR